MTNGCGPERASRLIPDKIFGVNMRTACDIHDYIYSNPSVVSSRAEADNLFLTNMKRLIKQKYKNPILQMTSFLGAVGYYLMVRLFGGAYFPDTEFSHL